MHATRVEPDGCLKISETIDLSTAEALRDALAECFDQDKPIELDLSEVTACDTAALQLLHAARNTAVRSARPFRVTALSAAITETGSRLGLPAEHLTFEPGPQR